MDLFVISDIHGMYKSFKKLLTYWNPEDKLVLLGDLVDRGPQSLEVIQKAMELKATYGDQVVFCMGNHERMLFDFLESPLAEQEFYLSNGGDETMRSFIGAGTNHEKKLDVIAQADYVQKHFAKELAFLESGKLYEIIGDVLLTHAGFDSSSADVSFSAEDDFLWIRDHFLQPNRTPYVNVFGHTPTWQIHETDDVWVSEDYKYIGIDGGCAYDGQLNAVLLTDEGEVIETYCV